MGLKKEKYFVLSCHREENIDLNFEKVIKIIDSVSKYYKLPIIFSAHPRTKKKIESKKIKFDPLVNLIEPLRIYRLCAPSDEFKSSNFR